MLRVGCLGAVALAAKKRVDHVDTLTHDETKWGTTFKSFKSTTGFVPLLLSLV
jgi:hypothetical protein